MTRRATSCRGPTAPAPTKTDRNGIDPHRDEFGRFTDGNPGGPGRPRGAIDLRILAEKQAELHGVDLEASLWGVVEMLLEKARGGCLAASRLLIDKICLSPADAARGPLISIDARGPVVAAPLPTDQELLDLVEELRQERVAAGEIGTKSIEGPTRPTVGRITGPVEREG